MPASGSFGGVSAGTTGKPVPIYIRNPNSEEIVLNLPSVTGSTNGTFTVVSNGCPLILGGKQACTIQVTMTPAKAGSVTGVLQLDSTAANAPGQVQLRGTGK